MKEKNRLRGRYLIEHDPSRDDPYAVFDLQRIFTNENFVFDCHTLEEAEELVKHLQKRQAVAK